MWAVKYEWPNGKWYNLNYYCHWDTIVARNARRSGHFLHSKVGVTQGDPLAMIVYEIRILPLICELQGAHLQVTNPWYAETKTQADTSKCYIPTWRN